MNKILEKLYIRKIEYIIKKGDNYNKLILENNQL